MQPENRFFLYEIVDNDTILRAASDRLYKVVMYWEPGRFIYFGNPKNHKKDITNKIISLKVIYQEYRVDCSVVEDELINY